MGKMKKTPVNARVSVENTSQHPIRSNDKDEDRQPAPVTYAKKNTSKKESSAKAMPGPPKSTQAVETKKRKAVHSNPSALTGPSRSAKEKESAPRKKKKASTGGTHSSLSGTSGTPLDAAAGESNSNPDSDSEEDLETTRGPSRRCRRRKIAKREYTESDCRRQLASLRSEDKRPPPSMIAESFAEKFKLPNEGINSHKWKIGKHISLEDVETVFGEEKGRNGFSLAEKLDPILRNEAEKLYCLCYQKTFAPTHVAKEFAIGFVLDQVQKEKVNWAEFAAETNVAQWKFYSRRVRLWVQRLANLMKMPLSDVYRAEGFSEYANIGSGRFNPQNVHCQKLVETRDKKEKRMVSSTHGGRNGDLELLLMRKTAVDELLHKVEAKLKENEEKVKDKKAEVDQSAVQREACFHLVEQFKSSLTEAGQDCSGCLGDEEIAAAIQQPGIGPIFKMYYSNVKKLSGYAATMSTLETELQIASAAVQADSNRLAALKLYSEELAAGSDGALMRPLPSCYNDNPVMLDSPPLLLPSVLECSICSGGFPFWDIIMSLCKHVYHPWCAVQWFKANITCAVPECGQVSPLWYNSWGFGQYDKILEGASHDTNTCSLRAEAPGEVTSEPSNAALGSCRLSECAPSMSACDSTFSKCLGEGKDHILSQPITGGMDDSDFSLVAMPVHIDGSCTPFGSQISTPSKTGKQTSTLTSTVETVPPIHPAATTEVHDVGDQKTVKTSSEVDNAGILDSSKLGTVQEVATAAEVGGVEKPETLVHAPIVAASEVGIVQELPMVLENQFPTPSHVFAVPEDDVILQCGETAPQLQASLLIGHGDDIVLPLLAEDKNTVQQQSTTKEVSILADIDLSPAQKDVRSTTDDPYSLTFQRSAKRSKKVVDTSINVTQPSTKQKSVNNEAENVSNTAEFVEKADFHSPTGEAMKDAQLQEGSLADTSGRVLRGRPTTGTAAAGTASSNPHVRSGSTKNKGILRSMHIDVSRGIENVPILLCEGDASKDIHVLDESFTYVRSLGIHASVTIEGSRSTSLGSTEDTKLTAGNNTHVANECSCDLLEDERHYDERGLLHSRYIVQFLKRRSGCSARFVYCNAVSYCSEFRNGRCDGHVPLQYIMECNRKCLCALDCPNRVVQIGVTAKLEVFYVNKDKGWGIRTLQSLERGFFVFEYAGEVVTNAELLRRGDRSKYALALDADWQSECVKDDESLLCIDATDMTNVARWLNHRCGDANLMEMPVWIENKTPTLYHVAFFTNRFIRAGEELTWDYGIDFDEEPSSFSCKCGSKACRGK